jgi:aspartyl-tRNA(Asn)/glutamyl-tRNA(Gln) amidotransferase subunit C
MNPELTSRVANLARLDLSEEEIRLFTEQLGQIIGYVDQLQEVRVEGVAPLVHPFENTPPLREDRARPSPRDSAGKPKVLEHAPEIVDDGFKVPPIL